MSPAEIDIHDIEVEIHSEIADPIEVQAEIVDVVVTLMDNIGPPGPPGEQGEQGEQGEPGPQGGNFTYVHTQDLASDIWTIVHNLDGFPNVTIVDSAGSVILGNIEYVDSNTITASFTAEFGGKAYLS